MSVNAFHPATIVAGRAAAHLFAEAKAAILNLNELRDVAPAVFNVIAEADDILAASPLSLRDLEIIRLVTRHEVNDQKPHNVLPLEFVQNDPQRNLLIEFVQHLSRSEKFEEDLVAIRAAGYSDEHLIAISLAVSLTIFSEIFCAHPSIKGRSTMAQA